jgi:hypothetical protein
MTGLSTRDRAFALLALIALAILAGMATHPSAGTGAGPRPVEPMVVLLQTLVWLIIAADVLVTAGIVYALWSDRERIVESRRKRSPLVYLAALLPSLFAAAMILVVRPAAGPRGMLILSRLVLLPPNRVPAASRLAGSTNGGDLMWISLLLAGLIVMLFLGWFFWGGQRRPTVAARQVAETKDAVVDVLEESIEAMRAIADPRRAIIAAYSAMEISMARAGLARRRAEAPMEFLARVLRSAVDISSDAKRLTYLFEFAKFSDHAVDESMRSDALDALARIRDQVGVAAAT